ncbi:uncharacterized protein LOC129229628 [Uloborus diversus]|uniref:uncharacterized protein LOC129229628 n=1 Tax=Uloborus diversus TaxID=327109 RepID=UPI002409AD7C|nr:uncharacterized protein LOC129229628 [Uloborus diversus]
MYSIFQFFLNGWKRSPEQSVETESSEKDRFYESKDKEIAVAEAQTDENAVELLLEEEGKLKAERKKAKKKRKKERKKQQELEQDPNSETNIDPSSAFVAVIAKKHRNSTSSEAPSKDCSVQTSNLPDEDEQIVILRSRELARKGNALATLGLYSKAVNLFSESIKVYPAEYRFYGNRSLCYERMGQYERALKDAEKSISLCYTWPTGYFRKGQALLGLQKYALAEECFLMGLKYDSKAREVLTDLRKVRILQIMEKGYSKELAESALLMCGSVEDALEELQKGSVTATKTDDSEIFDSDDEREFWSAATKFKKENKIYDIKTDPKNPEQHNSLWIGNVQPDVTEKKMLSLFSRYGELVSIKILPEKFCAFVNFKSKDSPGKAMAALQGHLLHGANLDIRFPNLPGETRDKKKSVVSPQAVKPKLAPVNGDECYFWRTTGCTYGDQCRYKHVRTHKGIDKKKWMAKSDI